ncbi:hypothetical protein BJX70DRAFT_407718 [Aspergillus crustosus]
MSRSGPQTRTMPPATATTGHVTKPAPLENTYTSDPSFRRILEWYLPPHHLTRLEPQLIRLGDEAISPQIREWSADAERNQPYVKSYDVWGGQYDVDRLVTSEGWKQLTRWGGSHGVVALGYEDTYGTERRLAQYAVNYLFSPSSGLTSCPISMTDGAALVLSTDIARTNLPPTHPFQTTLSRLLSRKADMWTSGQWMTERAGGSDVQNTETWATHSPLAHAHAHAHNQERDTDPDDLGNGEYLVSGFKFFSSATDANVALLLAKTAPGGRLSTFLVPLRRTIPYPPSSPSSPSSSPTSSPPTSIQNKTKEVTNGIRIHRLKTKLGTKELPTAELELLNTRAHLLGPLDKGVQTIAPLLNITRTHTFIGSVAAWRRALSITKAFAKARTTVGEPLWLIPMHLRLLAGLEGRVRGCLELSFFTVAVMGVVEGPDPATATQSSSHSHSQSHLHSQDNTLQHLPTPGLEATTVFRTLTALSKAVVSKMAIHGIQECQEALGGVGYMDELDEVEFNISRILRNTLVNSIWEGTTNVLASEFVRLLVKRDSDGRRGNLAVFGGWIERVLGLLGEGEGEISSVLGQAWGVFKAKMEGGGGGGDGDEGMLLADGRRAMFSLAWILGGVLLALDAQKDGDGVTGEIARRWVVDGELGVGDPVWRDVVYARRVSEDHNQGHGVSEDTVRWDCRIVWGVELPSIAPGHRSIKL